MFESKVLGFANNKRLRLAYILEYLCLPVLSANKLANKVKIRLFNNVAQRIAPIIISFNPISQDNCKNS